MTTLWILAAITFTGMVVCFVLPCKGRTPCLKVDDECAIAIDELPGEAIELYNYPAEYFGVPAEYKPDRLEIKYSHDKYVGLVIHEYKLIYRIGKNLDEKVSDYVEECVTSAKVKHIFRLSGSDELEKAEYDFDKSILTLTWG